ncbi:MAG: nucleoside 2-deoxyribosyltransferase, partial [Candidatus Aenigmatarchaeota archaeon]
MKIFLAGSFHTEEQEERLRDIYNMLKEEHYVWWAPEEVERGYDLEDGELKRQNFYRELDQIMKSDVLIAVMERGTVGTSIEIGLPSVARYLKDEEDKNTKVICYTVPGEDGSIHPDFESSSFNVVCDEVVEREEDIFEAIGRYE